MGFASDGAILVSALSAGRIWRVADGEVSEFRDVSALADDDFGDIVIDEHDRIYLANQGMSVPVTDPGNDRLPDLPPHTRRCRARGRPRVQLRQRSRHHARRRLADRRRELRASAVRAGDPRRRFTRQPATDRAVRRRRRGPMASAATPKARCGRQTRPAGRSSAARSTARSRTACRPGARWPSGASSAATTATTSTSPPRRRPCATRRGPRVRARSGAREPTCPREDDRKPPATRRRRRAELDCQSAFNVRRRTLPDGKRGISSTKTTWRSCLYDARDVRTAVSSSVAVTCWPSRTCTAATTASPSCASSTPNTAQSATPGSESSTPSISAGATWKPLTLIISLNRSVMWIQPSGSSQPMSPVRYQPSTNASAFASGREVARHRRRALHLELARLPARQLPTGVEIARRGPSRR